MATSVHRFFTELKPTHYELELVPDLEAMTFAGAVTVDLKKTGRPSLRITFHQHGLKIVGATIIRHDKKGDRELAVTRINHQNSLDEVRLHTNEQVYSGHYSVIMRFVGKITPGATGIYPCNFSYKGERHTMLATQFESHYAREAFPCIDEPEAKAEFDLTLITPKGLTVLANTPVKEQKATPKGTLKTTFETSPRMSTYLLAFVVGELQSKTTTTNHGVTVGVWSTIAHPLDSLDYALDISKRTVEFFEEYFGVPYPLPKLDNVAIPEIAASTGAMENWGLITYRESTILAYPGEFGQSTQEYIALVIAHETSHQWFGNLVTMRWWNDLWLNESFANMMEYQAVDALYPDWHIWNLFINREGLAAIRRDATPGVQAVKSTVRHPREIASVFDPYIVYAKGGRLLYMLKHYIGEETFRRGLTTYFNAHKFSNTVGDDLWKALSDTSGSDIAAFMHKWLNHPGFPIVSVTQNERQIKLDQLHFLEDGPAHDGQVWPVPLFSPDNTLPVQMNKPSVVYNRKIEKFIEINQGFAGHYIVNYATPEHRAYLRQRVSTRSVGIPDRLMFLNTASMIAKAGYQTFADVLYLLEAYKDETAEPVWGTVALIIAESRRFIDQDERIDEAIKKFVRTLVRQEYARLGWKQLKAESSSDSKLRALVLGLGAGADTPEIIERALQEFRAYRKTSKVVTTELRAVIFSVAARENAPDAVQFLLDLHDKTANSDLKEDIAVGLSATRDSQVIATLLERMHNPNLVRTQDFIQWLVFLLRNRYAREATWTWMTEYWAWIEQLFGDDKSYDDFPRYAAGVCNNAAWAARYRAFWEPLENDIALKRNILIGLTEISSRVKWLERDLHAVQEFFKLSSLPQ